MTSKRPPIEEVIDLDRYPLHDPTHARYRELLDYCRAELRDDGCCSVPGFFRSEAIARCAAMAERLSAQTHFPPNAAHAYGGEIDPELPADHPRRARFERGGGFICADLLDVDSPLWSFFDWPETTAFMMAAFETEPLHQYADPLSNMAINAMWQGDSFPWHFDTNELTVSVMLQKPDGGDLFEYVPNIRSPEDEHYDRVKRLFEGDRSGIRILELAPGDIQLFRGRYTAHRVTAVEGPRPRYVALPSWSSLPGQVGVVDRMINSYGRALPIHYERAADSPDKLAH